jgi:hypothetical protein
MKAKVKFDSAQLKGFLVRHVEKIVFGGFVAAFLFLCWSAFKLKPYDKTPDQLKSTAQQISQTVEQANPPDKIDGLAIVPDFRNLGAVSPAPVNPHLYRIDPFSRPYEDRQELRKEPKFYGLLDLVAYAGYGGIAINPEGGIERLETSSFGAGMDGSMGSMMGGMGSMMGSQMPGGMNPSAMGGMAGMAGMAGPGTGGSRMPEGMDTSMAGMAGGMGNMAGGMSAMGGMQGGRGRQRQPRNRRNTTAKKADVKKAVQPRPKPVVTERIVLPNPPPGSKLEGRYWICLTGAVPYREQFLEYQNTFRDARGYDAKRDFPRYALPIIERAEVVGGKPGNWESLDLEEALEDLSKWAADYEEVVDKRFVDPDLTEPLPPLIFANHDKDKVTHPLTKVEEQVAKVTATAKKRKATTLRGTRRVQVGGPNANRSMGLNNLYAAGDLANKLPEYRLFRFFDFTVEPGKTYQYRVKLQVENPNADVPPRYLQSYEYGKGKTRATEVSSSSAPITVIAGNRLLAGNVAPGPAGRGEPTGSILAKLFDANEAVEVRKVFDIHRGSVLNQREMEIGVVDPTKAMDERKSATVDFETNAVVLDMFGGEKLAGSRSAKVPGHMLILDNDGGFKTLLQASDSAMYETEQEEAKNQAPPKEGEKKQGATVGGDAGGNDPFKTFNFGDDDKSKGRKKR